MLQESVDQALNDIRPPFCPNPCTLALERYSYSHVAGESRRRPLCPCTPWGGTWVCSAHSSTLFLCSWQFAAFASYLAVLEKQPPWVACTARARVCPLPPCPTRGHLLAGARLHQLRCVPNEDFGTTCTRRTAGCAGSLPRVSSLHQEDTHGVISASFSQTALYI